MKRENQLVSGGVPWSLGRSQQFRAAPLPGIDVASAPEPSPAPTPDAVEPQ